jgi:hypothetical protein
MDKAAQAAKLKTQIAELDKRQGEVEGKLSMEQSALQRATQQRARLVEEFVGADAATVGWAETEIDKLDREITSRRRFIEAHESALRKIVAESESLRLEHVAVERALQQEAEEKALVNWQAELKQAVASASEHMAASREALAALNAAASRGADRFGARAHTVLTPLFEQFVFSHANLEQAGWRDSFPQYTRLFFTIRPMTRG